MHTALHRYKEYEESEAMRKKYSSEFYIFCDCAWSLVNKIYEQEALHISTGANCCFIQMHSLQSREIDLQLIFIVWKKSLYNFEMKKYSNNQF